MKCSVRGVGRVVVVVMASVGWMGCAREARASGDMGCSTSWKLMHHDFNGCNNMGFLAPANDSRVNLLLLMADLRPGMAPDAHPQTPFLEWGGIVGRFGTSADRAALKSDESDATPPADDPFATAVKTDGALKPAERDALLAARAHGAAVEAAAGALAHAKQVAVSADAKAYVSYLEGAAEFWGGDLDKAAGTFSSLLNAKPMWVRETAAYMVGRALIKRLQTGAFDEYGSFAKDWHADAKIEAAAQAALDKYLQAYPKGMYAQSARGLKRRGYWLAQDTTKLEAEYGALVMMNPSERNISDVELVQEIDNKLTTPPGSYGETEGNTTAQPFIGATENPILLAMLDLLAMRTSKDATPVVGSGAMSLADLEKQKPYFAGQMPLYEFLLAAHAMYVENKPAEVLRLIPDAARQGAFNYVQFSRQVLRGMALEATKDRNALGFWMQMLPGSKLIYQRPIVELAIAYHEERSGQIRDVFAAQSPVHVPYLRQVLLANVADADLLRTQATNKSAPHHEREIALFTLLYKEATRGHAAEFLKDLALVPTGASADGYFVLDADVDSGADAANAQEPAKTPLGVFLHDKTDAEFGCPGLKTSEAQLAQNAENATAQLCVADFVRLNQVMYVSADEDGDALGDTPSLFPGGDYVRMDTYKAVLLNPKASRNDKAYALYRAVNCYGPSGNNDCGGKDVPKAQRKQWFTTLKRDYAGTKWANEQQYYW